MRQFQTAVMGLGNPAGNGQAEAGATAVVFSTGARFVSAEKALEDAGLQVRWNATPRIGDAQGIFLSPPTARNADASTDRKSTRLNSSHSQISYAVFCL